MWEAEILREAKRLIEIQGWCQNAYKTPDGRICMGEAITRVLGGCDHSFCHRLIVDANGIPGGLVSAWNDEPGRTLEEVYQAFDKAIELAEKISGNNAGNQG